MNINDLKIKVKPKYYYGYFQGVTVHINGKKFPTEKNYEEDCKKRDVVKWGNA